MESHSYIAVFQNNRGYWKKSLYSTGKFFAQRIERCAKNIEAKCYENKNIDIFVKLKDNREYAIKIIKNCKNGYTYIVNGNELGDSNKFIAFMKEELRELEQILEKRWVN